MNHIVCKDESEWVRSIHESLLQRVKQYQAQSLFLPAGETPRPLYSFWENEKPQALSQLRFYQVDEILSGSHASMFQKFFKDTLPSFQAQFEYIDQAESVADLALLGLGLNGHVAFHEPGLPASFYSGCLSLNRETSARLDLRPDARVVSYGLGAFLKCKAILLVVRGKSKKEILSEILKPESQLPAALLKSHGDFSIISLI